MRGPQRDPDSGVEDPLERLEKNERSQREAVRFGVLSAAAVGGLALVLSLVVRPESGQGFTADRLEVLGIPWLLALGLALTATIKTYLRWKHHVRWRPWLWLTQVMWIGATSYLVLMGTVLVARVPGP